MVAESRPPRRRRRTAQLVVRYSRWRRSAVRHVQRMPAARNECKGCTARQTATVTKRISEGGNGVYKCATWSVVVHARTMLSAGTTPVSSRVAASRGKQGAYATRCKVPQWKAAATARLVSQA